jgi:predicted phage tail component-like protein
VITVTYDNVRLTDRFIIVGIKRPMPEFRPITTQVSGADGEAFDGLTVGPREVSMTLISKAKGSKGLQDAARVLMSLLAKREPARLTISDELDHNGIQLCRFAVPKGSFNEREFANAEKWDVSFVQPDPYLYGKSRAVTIKAGETLQVTAGGNAKVWPTAITSPVGSSYTISARGGHVKYDGTLTGRRMVIDMKKQSVVFSDSPVTDISSSIAAAAARLTGEAGSGLRVGSKFFSIEGVEKISATHGTTLVWRERWL